MTESRPNGKEETLALLAQGLKWCSKHQCAEPVTNFNKAKSLTGLRSDCKKAQRGVRASWSERNPSYRRDYYLANKSDEIRRGNQARDKRRVVKAGQPFESITREDVLMRDADLYGWVETDCHTCGHTLDLDRDAVHLDHLIPLLADPEKLTTLGLTFYPGTVLENLSYQCASCGISKNNRVTQHDIERYVIQLGHRVATDSSYVPLRLDTADVAR